MAEAARTISPNATHVFANGYAMVAALGAAVPTDVASAWPAAWAGMGVISEDGLTESRDESSDDYWGRGSLLLRTVRSKHKRTFKVSALEDNPVVKGLIDPNFFKTVTTGVATTYIKNPTKVRDLRMFGFEDTDGISVYRVFVPNGEVVNVGDAQKTENGMLMRELTINVYPVTYNANSDVLYVEITNDPYVITTSS